MSAERPAWGNERKMGDRALNMEESRVTDLTPTMSVQVESSEESSFAFTLASGGTKPIRRRSEERSSWEFVQIISRCNPFLKAIN